MMRRAFTLVELAVVLIALGLLAGAVLSGQSLIHAAEIRGIITQKEKYTLAVNNFKMKYNDYLPGDMPPSLAARLGFYEFTGATAGTTAYGDADGTIDTVAGVEIECVGECWVFWRHLAEARLIDRTPVYFPKTKVGDVYFAAGQTYSQMNALADAYFGVGSFYAGRQGLNMGDYAQPWMTPADAYAVDEKMDDGKPGTGDMIINQLDYGPAFYGAWWSAAAANGKCTYGGATWMDAAARYNVANAAWGSVVSCMPLFRMR